MLQRAGLAQALMNDPELVVLDEPTSGLDPIGRKEVRDLIIELREQGKTVFFSSHILTDIEAIADHVAIVARGQLQSQGTPAELIKRTILGIDIQVRVAADADLGTLTDGASRIRRTGDELSLTLPADADIDAWLSAARDKGAKVVAVTPRHETLEDLFLRQIASADSSSAAQEGRV
jgi:ABC-2 type transport system ATP-binding protein